MQSLRQDISGVAINRHENCFIIQKKANRANQDM